VRHAVVVFVALVLAVTRFVAVDASTGPIPLMCERACLEKVIDDVIAAMAAHDPKRVPLSADVKYTENAQVVQVGDGFWKTSQGVGNYKHYFADPEAGQVAFMGTVREADAPLLYSLRVRIELGRITEIESVLFRPGGGGPNNIAAMDKLGKPEELWFRTIPPAQRLSRQEMISIADAYFTGVQRNDGKGVNGTGTYPFTPDCHRIENGAPTTNVPAPAGQKPGTINPFQMDCLTAFKMGLYYVVTNVHSRRYPLVDAERGIVWAHCVFDQGTVNQGILSDGTKHSYAGFNRPGSILVTEAFLIEGGKIRRVEMIGPSAVYHMNSPWGGLSGD
jgi:hypothetical protein